MSQSHPGEERSARDQQGATSRQVTLPASQRQTTCPRPEERVWDSHPRVSIDLQPGQPSLCPYCSTEYRLDDQ